MLCQPVIIRWLFDKIIHLWSEIDVNLNKKKMIKIEKNIKSTKILKLQNELLNDFWGKN